MAGEGQSVEPAGKNSLDKQAGIKELNKTCSQPISFLPLSCLLGLLGSFLICFTLGSEEQSFSFSDPRQGLKDV